MYYISVLIFLILDPVLGFQFANVIYFLQYFIGILELFYQEPRAFWKYTQIRGSFCAYTFA